MSLLFSFRLIVLRCVCRPDLIDYPKLSRSNAKHNLENAFTVAEEKLGLTKLLDAEGCHLSHSHCRMPCVTIVMTSRFRCRRHVGVSGRPLDHHVRRDVLPLLFEDEGGFGAGTARGEGSSRCDNAVCSCKMAMLV